MSEPSLEEGYIGAREVNRKGKAKFSSQVPAKWDFKLMWHKAPRNRNINCKHVLEIIDKDV